MAAYIRDVPDYPQPGVLFKDITPLLADAAAFAATVDALAELAGDVDAVVGIEARGFMLAAPVAFRAGAGFVPVRKAGKLPAPTLSAAYALEYGEAVLELREGTLAPGARVLVVDDVLATGGTLAATVGLLERSGAQVVGIAVLLEIAALGGRQALPGRSISALLQA
ncbi:adenine phosphoribosyltransferase [Motilibacter deserti]|uniref:adenine phosphoribosyltransferase n=1 Tax=Motilibacter deserti TaxID=2714956 RepID=UPI0018C89B81|nr:adenine phosphoribosyltransferase [Motilibacter deserti]